MNAPQLPTGPVAKDSLGQQQVDLRGYLDVVGRPVEHPNLMTQLLHQRGVVCNLVQVALIRLPEKVVSEDLGRLDRPQLLPRGPF